MGAAISYYLTKERRASEKEKMICGTRLVYGRGWDGFLSFLPCALEGGGGGRWSRGDEWMMSGCA